MEIPHEIFAMITDYLPKIDWKSLRLVSREFNNVTSELPFFKELWFSPHAEDLEVFHGVCEHPQWAKQVTTIIYDKTLFYPWTLNLVRLHEWPHQPDISEPQHQEWIASHPGPAIYIQHCQAQESVDQLGLLIAGMRKLPNLSRFHISAQFLDGPPVNDDGKRYSPLARAWKDWLAPPSWEPVSSHAARIILSAIALSGARITEFSTLEEDNRLEQCKICGPANTFHFESPIFQGVQAMFGNLTTLKIRLMVEERHGSSQFTSFGKLLRKAEKIEKLVLEFQEPYIDRVEYPNDYTWQANNRVDLGTLFGDTRYPRLQLLELRGMKITVESMDEFLRRHLNSLCGLKLEVEFFASLEDQWASFVEFITELKEGLLDGLEMVPDIQGTYNNSGL